MKDTGLLMKPEMVNATLERLKTHTRRTQGLDEINFDCGRPSPDLWKYSGVEPDGVHHTFWLNDGGLATKTVKCPYGGIGDRLWVRETFRMYQGILLSGSVVYRADEKGIPKHYPWKPSIFMPRWASRINLEIVDIRVERIQDISGHDCISEGIDDPSYHSYLEGELKARFESLWDSINAARGYGWDINPWVFVIVFRII